MKLHNSYNALAIKFTGCLLEWNKAENNRQMPWKGEKDPYKIWLSEIILQQTRVEQGINYYKNFISNFPTVHHLADASEKQVFKFWEGLGYYNRCRNIITTAKYISKERHGNFPADYHSIISLKGVGPYTAAAISSFAYNLPYAVTDGNVLRVLSRIFNINTPVDTGEGKKFFHAIAQDILPINKAAEYNQAIMDFGATICSPLPKCNICFFTAHCKAFQKQQQYSLPVKNKKIIIKERWFNYIILKKKDKYAIQQRKSKDIWQNLYEFYLIETTEKAKEESLFNILQKELNFNFSTSASFTSLPSQRLTHQLIHYNFIEVDLKESKTKVPFIWVSHKDLRTYPFPNSLKYFIDTQLIVSSPNAGRKFVA